MITRVIQRKRPRSLALLIFLGAILVAAGLFAAVAIATVVDSSGNPDCDIQVTNKLGTDICTTEALAKVRYIGDKSESFGSSGTGTFSPFVRLQGSTSEAGYNTDGTLEFDTKAGTWTSTILVSEIPIRTEDGCVDCWELWVDINESNSTSEISLNQIEIWFTTDADLTGYDDPWTIAQAQKQYDFSGTILINDVNQGSGRGDLRYMVPLTGITIPTNCNYGNTACTTYFLLYSEWGTTAGFESDGGFEEWKVKIYPVPPDISVAKDPNAGSINGGQNAVFTIVVTNNGPVTAENVTLSDTLPTGFTWTLGGPNAGSCAINAGVLTCNFGSVLNQGTRTITLTAPTTTADCGTINNTVTVSATGDVAPVGNNTDSGAITVSCGALQITKTAKHADSDPETGTSPNLVATFSIVDAGGNSHSITTDATGVGCVGGVTIGLTQSITETGVPTGYSAPTIANVTVASGTCTSGVMTGGTNVPVTNTPLTTIGWSVDSLVIGGTSTVVTCRDSAGEIIDGYPITIDGDGDDTGSLANLPPTAPGTTVSCDFVVDP